MPFSVLPPAFNKSQRIGILSLLLIIVGLQFVLYYFDFSRPIDSIELSSREITAFQKQIDSLKELELDNKKPKVYLFNPSFITDYKGYKLGLSTEEIDKLLAYRKKGKYINSVKEFQQVSGVSDSLLAVLTPYFKFPDWLQQKNKSSLLKQKKWNKSSEKKMEEAAFSGVKNDLNTATKQDLIKIKGIGEKLANRIIKYRQKLHGYLIDEQLYEVWYLDKEVADKVLQRFTVINKPDITPININTASFKEVLHAPYMDYELTKKIFEYRDEMAEIQSLEELKKIEGFPLDKFDRISLYLTAE